MPDESSPDFGSVIQALATALEQCLEAGFVLPLYATTVAVNSAMVFVRYEAADQGGLKAEMLAQHITKDGMYTMPINIMISDAQGQAARVLIGPDGEPQLMMQ